jgi:hypothetical protein
MMPVLAPSIVEPPSSLPVAAGTVATLRQHLGQMLTAAVEDGLIPRNPAAGARMPRSEAAKPDAVPVNVIEAITAGVPDWFRVAIPLGLGAGLRQGETCGLTVDRPDLLRRTLRVDRQLVTRVRLGAVLDAPRHGRRSVRSRSPGLWSTP